MTKEVVSLELFKKHTRTDDYDDDDEYLTFLLKAATEQVTTATCRTEKELLSLGGGDAYPYPLQQAIMMIAAHWFNQRESVSNVQLHEVPSSLQALIKPFRKLSTQ